MLDYDVKNEEDYLSFIIHVDIFSVCKFIEFALNVFLFDSTFLV